MNPEVTHNHQGHAVLVIMITIITETTTTTTTKEAMTIELNNNRSNFTMIRTIDAIRTN